jgi:hypothetical protein
MNYNIFKTSKFIATFKLSGEVMKQLKQYSKIMNSSSPLTSCQDMLIKTDKDKNIIVVLCNLSWIPYTWADGVTVQDQTHSSTIPSDSKSKEHFMHYAPREYVKLNSNARENIIMPVIVPPIADYNCDIYELNKSTKTGLIEMRTQTHFFTFRTNIIM